LAVRLGYENVYRYAEGLPDWKEMGLPTERGQISLAQPSGIGAPGSTLFQSGLLLTLVGVFFGGLALNLTPCVYPLIPITVSYFGGRGTDKAGLLAVQSLFFLLGLAVTNSTLGVVAALTGGLLGSVLQHPAVLIALATILVGLALSFFGLWELRLPGFLTQAASRSYGGYGGSLFMGLTLGVVAAPCIGPFLIGLLTYVASTGNPYLGFMLFFTLSLGLGIPLAILAFFSGKLDRLPRSGEWMIWVRRLLGWVLVAMAAYFIKPLFSSHLAGIILLPAVILAAGVHLGFIDRTMGTFRGFGWLKKGIGTAFILLASYQIVSAVTIGPGVTWQPYSEQLLKKATSVEKPVIIDFYADWCAPCRELEQITFHDSAIVKLAESDFVMIKVDLTRKGDPMNENLLRQYEVRGVPTVVFLNKNGRERSDLRVVDFLPPAQFIKHMAVVRNTGS
jgi:thiol:disulfide interchange protein DsbD